jgi:hypothetical protein
MVLGVSHFRGHPMSEQEWLASNNPSQLLLFLSGKPNDRKLILFCVHHWSVNMAADEDWFQELDMLTEKVINTDAELYQLIGHFCEIDVTVRLATPIWWADRVLDQPQSPDERVAMAQSVRDVFGNPFRSVNIDSSWLTSDVRILAEGIYQDRAFDRMPILADALQDAGCDNEDILNHCRQTGEHVRGCWVVDLLLGKT